MFADSIITIITSTNSLKFDISTINQTGITCYNIYIKVKQKKTTRCEASNGLPTRARPPRVAVSAAGKDFPRGGPISFAGARHQRTPPLRIAGRSGAPGGEAGGS